MSRVTNLILVSNIALGDNCSEHISKWLEAYYSNPKARLLKIDQNAGGNKAMEIEVFAGAFNYLSVKKMLAAIAPDMKDHRAMLIIKEEESDIHIVRYKELT